MLVDLKWSRCEYQCYGTAQRLDDLDSHKKLI